MTRYIGDTATIDEIRRHLLGIRAGDDYYAYFFGDHADGPLDGVDGFGVAGDGVADYAIGDGLAFSPGQLNSYLWRSYTLAGNRRWAWGLIDLTKNPGTITNTTNSVLSTLAFCQTASTLTDLVAHTVFSAAGFNVTRGPAFTFVGAGAYRQIRKPGVYLVAVGVDITTNQCFILDPYGNIWTFAHGSDITALNTGQAFWQHHNLPAPTPDLGHFWVPRWQAVGFGQAGRIKSGVVAGAASAQQMAGMDEYGQMSPWVCSTSGWWSLAGPTTYFGYSMVGRIEVIGNAGTGGYPGQRYAELNVSSGSATSTQDGSSSLVTGMAGGNVISKGCVKRDNADGFVGVYLPNATASPVELSAVYKGLFAVPLLPTFIGASDPTGSVEIFTLTDNV